MKEPTNKEQLNKILRILEGNGAIGLIERFEHLEKEHRSNQLCNVSHDDLAILRTGQQDIETKIDDHVAWHADSHKHNIRLALTTAVAIGATVWGIVATFGGGG